MLRDALSSACIVTPQARHANFDWLDRFLRSMWWHWEHCWLVYAGSMYTSGTPARSALYAMYRPSWWKLH